MIQILLHGLKMDPLVSLHYYAPVCALINLAILPFTEGLAPFYEIVRVGPLILISNACVAFCLNIAAVFLVGAGSGLVLTLAGVFKVRVDRPHFRLLLIGRLFAGHSSHYGLCVDLRIANHATAGRRCVPLLPDHLHDLLTILQATQLLWAASSSSRRPAESSPQELSNFCVSPPFGAISLSSRRPHFTGTLAHYGLLHLQLSKDFILGRFLSFNGLVVGCHTYSIQYVSPS